MTAPMSRGVIAREETKLAQFTEAGRSRVAVEEDRTGKSEALPVEHQ